MIAFALAVCSAEQTAGPTPLEKGEITFEQMSINDITERYSAYERVNHYGQLDSGEVTFGLSCDGVEITLVDYGKELSFAGDDALEYMRSFEDFSLTEADKGIMFSVSRILCMDEEIIGLRGVKIGDSLDSANFFFLKTAFWLQCRRK